MTKLNADKKELVATIHKLSKNGLNPREIAKKIGTYRQRVEYFLRTYPLLDLQRNSKRVSLNKGRSKKIS